MAQIVTSSTADAPSMVIFSTNSLAGSVRRSKSPILRSWGDGPQKMTGYVKRGRPKKQHKNNPVQDDVNETAAGKVEELKFKFITYTEAPKDAWPKVRKAVRSHAMLEYRRQERSRKLILHDKMQENIFTNASGKSDAQQGIQQLTNFLHTSLATVEPFNAFPADINAFMLGHLTTHATTIYDVIYTVEKLQNFNPVKEHWIPLSFQDPAVLHALVVCTDVYLVIARGARERPAAVKSLGLAIKLVNERLGAGEISDGTIVVVCALAHAELMSGNLSNWKVHMKGLRQMVHLRGGQEAFAASRLILSKMYRADLAGSIDQFTAPYFPPPCDIISFTPPLLAFRGIAPSITLEESLAKICACLEPITRTMDFLYRSPNKIDIHPLRLREDISSLQYTLLANEFNRDDPVEHLVNQTLRLGVLMYLITLLNEMPPIKSISMGIGSRLLAYLREVRRYDVLDAGLGLWMVFIGTSLMQDGDGRNSFLELGRKILGLTAWRTWEVVKGLLRGFYWVEGIHGRPFERVWEDLWT